MAETAPDRPAESHPLQPMQAQTTEAAVQAERPGSDHANTSQSRQRPSRSLLSPPTGRVPHSSGPRPGSRSPMSPSQRRKMVWKLVQAYAPDWVLSLALIAIFGALDNIAGFKREFSLTDTSLRHPYAIHERVPNWALYVIAVLSPAVLQGVVNFLTVKSWWDLHNSLLGLLLSLSLTGSITQVVKLTVGRPRPDVIARCVPPEGAVDPTFGLTSADICTRPADYILHDGWRSFPSGHSSLSFAGLGFLAFYLSGKLHLFDTRGHAHKAWIAITPLAGATLVAVSRTMDYRHHWQDVTAGSILGLVLSFFSYRQYYPSLASPYSHRPFFPRHKPQESMTLPLHRPSDSHDRYEGSPHGEAQYGGYTDVLLHHEDDNVSMDGVPPGTMPKDEIHTIDDVWTGENVAQDTRTSQL